MDTNGEHHTPSYNLSDQQQLIDELFDYVHTTDAGPAVPLQDCHDDDNSQGLDDFLNYFSGPLNPSDLSFDQLCAAFASNSEPVTEIHEDVSLGLAILVSILVGPLLKNGLKFMH